MIHASIKTLVDNGFAIHLLKPKSKMPAMGFDWSNQPVLSWEDLKKAYKKDQNFGVRLGKFSKVDGNFLHCIDMDIRDDSLISEALANLQELFPDYESFPTVKSGSGGNSRHFYFLSDKAFSSRKITHSKTFFVDEENKKHWDWEIELFGTGKQVAIPPSIHPSSGKPYVWLSEFDFDDLVGESPFVASSEMPESIRVRADDLTDDENELMALLSPPRGLTLEEIHNTLDALPIEEWCEDREQWLITGMAVHHETKGSDEGFDVWAEWSENSAKYEEDDARRVWNSFRPKANKITMGTLLKAVKDLGLEFDQCMKRLKSCETYNGALRIIAEYDLLPSEISSTLSIIVSIAERQGRQLNKTDAAKDVKAVIREARLIALDRFSRSIEQWLADEVLRLFYNEGRHLTSINGAFWHYCDGYWWRPDQNIIGFKIVQVVEKALGSSEEIAEPLRKALRASGRGETLNAFANSIMGVLLKSCSKEDDDDPLGLCREEVPAVMNCTNGEIWFGKKDFAFKDHNPDTFLTYRLNTAYDPMAECPEWDKALDTIFSDKEDREEVIRHLYELMGYIIQSQRDLACWVLFYGDGQNGKSFVMKTLSSIIGTKGWVAKSIANYGQNSNNHIEAGLVGKVLLLDDDFPRRSLLPDSALKKMAEAKQMTANPKGGEEYNFICRSVPVILSNHWPKTQDSSYGLERRAQIFNFSYRIPDREKDAQLWSRIYENELPGILNHLIAGYRRLKKRGDFKPPMSCKKAKDTWVSGRNGLSTFMAEHIEITGVEADVVKATDLWQMYQLWVVDEGTGKGWGRNTFYEEMTYNRGVTKYSKDGSAVFRGLKLRRTGDIGNSYLLENLEDEEENDLLDDIL